MTTSTTKAPRLRRRSFVSYDSALKYLGNRTNFERTRPNRVDPDTFKLERMRALAAAMGDPHRDVKVVHVAGSKGKGSTVEMLAASLGACGYATGVFTSPHMVDVRERIRINDQLIGEDDFVRLLGRVAGASASIADKHGDATFFECITALALAYFADQAVDLAIIEVGLGGRLDSTNIVEPEVCAITEIQLEHTELLGKTLEDIAREKGGIIKPGVTTITVPQAPEVLGVLRQIAEERAAPLLVLGEDVGYSCRFEASTELGPHARVCLNSPQMNYDHLAVPLKGEHQAPNCGLALAALAKLVDRGFIAPEIQVAKGLARTPCNGRLEVVWKSPSIVLDGAHNPESVQALVKAIGATIRYDSMVVIFGCAADKNVDGMLEKIALGADKIIFTKCADNPRAIEPKELQKRFANISQKMTQTTETLKEAINTAHKGVDREDLICVTGSFHLAGEAKQLLQKARAKLGE